MAVSLNNPWSAGAVVFDQRPYMAFYERQMAKEQAKNDALENYFKDLHKNITSAGMRSQDVPALLQKNKEWEQHNIQNKAAILNPKLDNGDAYRKYMSGYQDQLAVINESKEAQKDDEQLAKLKFNKDFSYMFDDPDIMNNMTLANLPIGDPRRKRFDVASAMIPPKPISVKEKEEFSKYIIGDTKPDKIPGAPINIGGFKTQTPITSEYSDSKKMIFGQKAADIYDTDRNWKAEANKSFKELQHDPIQYDRLNKIYKKYYGNDIDNPREAFIAKTIADHDIKTIDYEKGEDIFGRQKAMENIRFGHQKQLKSQDQKDVNDWIVNFWDTRIANAKAGQPTLLPDPDSPLTIKMAYELQADKTMLEGLTRNGKQPDRVYVTLDNKILPIYFNKTPDYNKAGKKIGMSPELDDNGNPVIDREYSKPIDMDQAYLSLGYKGQTKKELGSTMSNVYNKKTNPAATRKYSDGNNTYTHDELLKLGYNEDKIKQYIDAGILK